MTAAMPGISACLDIGILPALRRTMRGGRLYAAMGMAGGMAMRLRRGTGGGAAEPALRSAVSAIIATVTPGMARTAASACARTFSQARASAASTLMEKNTLPSEAVIADSTSAWGKATPRGDITLARASRTCCCVTLKGASPKYSRKRPIERSRGNCYRAPISSRVSTGAALPPSLAAS